MTRSMLRDRCALTVASLVLGSMVTASAPAADIVETAVAAGDFNTLVAAVDAAGLVETLQGDGPFTVFAPTDEAFAKLGHDTLDSLLKKSNRQKLTDILTYHVASGNLGVADVATRRTIQTVNGQRLDISTESNRLTIDGANLILTNIQCDNGVIHVIDSVMLPSMDNLVQSAQSAGMFGTLLAAVTEAGLAPTLANEGPFTVLAPTDEAFAKLGHDAIDDLLKKENRAQLTAILTYHVIPGRVYSEQALSAGNASTLQGGTARFALDNGRFRVNNANIISVDIEASNGVAHVIDTVLMPPKPRPSGRLVIGIYDETPSAALASQLGLDRHNARVVTGFTSGSNAQAAGLQKYDIIIDLDGMGASSEAFTKAKEAAGFGNTVHLTILRNGKRKSIDVEVGVSKH
ncbi:MAG: fasciclin domain-containing protein [Planctomycetota bacterium]